MKLLSMFAENKITFKKIFIIFIIGLILRLSYVVFVPQIDIKIGDSDSYSTIGRNIVTHGKYTTDDIMPDIYWAPGYPFFISFIYKLFGINNMGIRIVQAVLSSLVIIFIYFICARVFNKRIGMLSSLIVSIYPGFIGYSGLLLPQILALFLLTLFILLIVKFDLKIYIDFILGLIAGYLCLVRSEFVLFMPILFLIIAKNSKKLKHLIIIFIIMCSMISIWSMRNYKVFGKFVLISVHYGDTLWISTWKEEWLEWQEKEPFISLTKGLDQIDSSAALFKAGINNIKEYPFVYLKMCTKRFYRFWLTGHSNVFYFMMDSLKNYIIKKEYLIALLKIIMLFFNTSIIILGFFGIKSAYKNIKNNNLLYYLLTPIIFFIILHFFTFATPRYSVPIMPFVIVFASYAIAHKYHDNI